MTDIVDGRANNDGSHLVKYKPEFCVMLIAHMSEGYSFMSFGAIARAGRMTLYNWCDHYPEFKEAKQIGEASALKFFETAIKSASTKQVIDEKVLLKKFNPKDINIATMQWFIKNRFGKDYNEKSTLVVEGGEKPIEVNHAINLDRLSLEELKQLRALKEKLDATTIIQAN